MQYKQLKKYPLYEVSLNGDVRRKGGEVLKPFENNCGYGRVNMYFDGCRRGGKSVFVHRLVAETFLSNKQGKPCINHIDGNKRNNAADNLEWVSYRENVRHAKEVLGRQMGCKNRGEAQGRSKLTKADVVRVRINKERLTQAEWATLLGVTQGNISALILNKSWKHI